MGRIRQMIAGGLFLLAGMGCSGSDYFTKYEKPVPELVNYRAEPEKMTFIRQDGWEKSYRLNEHAQKYMDKSSGWVFIAAGNGLEGTYALYEQADADKDGIVSLIEAQEKYDEIDEACKKKQ